MNQAPASFDLRERLAVSLGLNPIKKQKCTIAFLFLATHSACKEKTKQAWHLYVASSSRKFQFGSLKRGRIFSLASIDVNIRSHVFWIIGHDKTLGDTRQNINSKQRPYCEAPRAGTALRWRDLERSGSLIRYFRRRERVFIFFFLNHCLRLMLAGVVPVHRGSVSKSDGSLTWLGRGRAGVPL